MDRINKLMSHYTTITTELRDKQSLISALKEIGYNVNENSNGIQVKRPTLNGFPYYANFQIVNGKYQASYDVDFGKQWLSKLTQLYGVHRTLALCKQRGIKANVVRLTNGEIKVVTQH
jgi:hypothetical protein